MLLQIDATAFFVFISFFIFVILMNLICYKPLTKIINEREKFYEKNKKTVLETENKKEDVIKGVEQEISKAKLESSKLLKQAVSDGNLKKEEAYENKKQEIVNRLNEYKNNLKESSNLVKKEIKEDIEDYVKTTVSKVLKIDKDQVNVDKTKIDEILKWHHKKYMNTYCIQTLLIFW